MGQMLGSGKAKVENNPIPNLKSLIIESENTHKNDFNIAAIIEVHKKCFSHMNDKCLWYENKKLKYEVPPWSLERWVG